MQTLLRYDENRLSTYQGIARQLKMGRQVYIVYPLINENEKLDLRSLEEGYENICEIYRDYRVAYVHGRLKPEEGLSDEHFCFGRGSDTCEHNRD